MEIPAIRSEKREHGGHGANDRLRRRGLVPAVIYGHQQAPVMIAVSRHDLELALEHSKHVVQLDAEGQAAQYLVKDVQYDHLHKDAVHVDFMRAARDERVHVKVGLELKGEPHGTHEGGELVQLITDLDLECPLNEIPEMLTENVKHLGLAEALHVKDLKLPSHLKPLHAPDDIIAIVRPKRGVSVTEEEGAVPAEEASNEPEVIGRGPKESEDEGGA
ncbi:MAG: 50S ribosomal protein L25 [Phycisphaerae bacterium]